MKILLLEDDAETAAAVKAGLLRERHEVVVAGDVASALRVIDAEHFEAAILDVALPDGTGYEALAALRDGSPGAFVLMLTARGTVEDRVKGLD